MIRAEHRIYMYYQEQIDKLKQGQFIWLKCPFCKNGKVRIKKGNTLQVRCNVEGEL